MRVSGKMGSTKYFMVLVLLAVYIQNIKGDIIGGGTEPAHVLRQPYPLATRQRDRRGLLEQTNKAIKDSVISSWNFVKTVAQNTRNDIQKWAEGVREYAAKLEASLENTVRSLRGLFDSMIADILGAGKRVQQCVEDEGGKIKDTLGNIRSKMSRCLSNAISKLTEIQGKHGQLAANDTALISDLDRNLDACKAEKTDYDRCLNTVTDMVYDAIEEKHNEIQTTGVESKSLADNIRDTLTRCSEENIAEATTFLASEVMEVVRCSLKASGIPISTSE